MKSHKLHKVFSKASPQAILRTYSKPHLMTLLRALGDFVTLSIAMTLTETSPVVFVMGGTHWVNECDENGATLLEIACERVRR